MRKVNRLSPLCDRPLLRVIANQQTAAPVGNPFPGFELTPPEHGKESQTVRD